MAGLLGGGLWGIFSGNGIGGGGGTTIFPQRSINDILLGDKAKEQSYYLSLFGTGQEDRATKAVDIATKLLDAHISPTAASSIAAELTNPAIAKMEEIRKELIGLIPGGKTNPLIDVISELIVKSQTTASPALEEITKVIKNATPGIGSRRARIMAENVLQKSGARSVDPAALGLLKANYNLTGADADKTAMMMLTTVGWRKLGLKADPFGNPIFGQTSSDPLRYVTGKRTYGSYGMGGGYYDMDTRGVTKRSRRRRTRSKYMPRTPYKKRPEKDPLDEASSGSFQVDMSDVDDSLAGSGMGRPSADVSTSLDSPP